jgi:hypothetical protein
MSVSAFELAKLVIRTHQIAKSGRRPFIRWEEACLKAGAEPALMPVIVALLSKGERETLMWAKRVVARQEERLAA